MKRKYEKPAMRVYRLKHTGSGTMCNIIQPKQAELAKVELIISSD